MREKFRQYATDAMEAVRDGAMSGGMNSKVDINETYMSPGQAKGEEPIVFDFQGTHDDGTTVMGEIVFRQFDIEPGECKKCRTFVDEYGDKLCEMCKDELEGDE